MKVCCKVAVNWKNCFILIQISFLWPSQGQTLDVCIWQSSSHPSQRAHLHCSQRKSNKSKLTSIFLICLFDNRGIFHIEFILPSQAITGEFCHTVRTWPKKDVKRKHPDRRCRNNWVLHHNNVINIILSLCSSFCEKQYGSCSHPLYYAAWLHPTFFSFPSWRVKSWRDKGN